MITYAQKAKGNTVSNQAVNNPNPAANSNQSHQQVQQQLLGQQVGRQQQQSAAQQINARSQQQMSQQPRFQMTQLIPTSMPGLYSQYPYTNAYAIQQQQQQQAAMQQQQAQQSQQPQQQQPRSNYYQRQQQHPYYQQQQQPPQQQPARSSYRGRRGGNNRYNGYNNQYQNPMSKPSYSSRSGSHSSHSFNQTSPNQKTNQKPNQNQSSYESRGGRSYRRDTAYHGRNKQPRGKPTAAQLRTYQTVADRDVLCWIFENHGRCRYGEKCQWLHLDRVTGQYVPTVYIMNSMDTSYSSNKPKDIKSDKDNDGATQTTSGDNKEDEAETKEEPANGPDADNNEQEKEKEEEEVDTVELAEKFKKMMAKQIEDRIKEEKEKKEKEAEMEEEAVEEPKEEKKEIIKEVKTEKEKEKVSLADEEEVERVDINTKYASYGTTFDKQNVCWEFNTFVGCRKGSSCKWAHQYLMKGATHPYTGEKLDGMAVKEFRKKNNI